MPRKPKKNVTPAPPPFDENTAGDFDKDGIVAFDIPDEMLEELARDPTSGPADTISVDSAGPDDGYATLGDLSRALIPLGDQLRATVAEISLIPFAFATPEQRTELIRLRDALDKPRQDLSTWVDAIDVSIRQAALDTQAKEFLLADGKVTVEPPRGEWVVNVPALADELKELVKAGLVSQAEVEDVLVTHVIVKADNSKLNQLKKRGAAVSEAIDRYRVWKAGNPTSAKIRFEGRTK